MEAIQDGHMFWHGIDTTLPPAKENRHALSVFCFICMLRRIELQGSISGTRN
jgi:hypothetical protein